MVWDASEPAVSTDFLVAAGKIRANNAALETVLGAARLAAGTNIADLFPIYGATPMLFYMSAPPVGWTEVADIGDTLVAVKGGTSYIEGGNVSGSWALPDHTLTIAEIPAHIHTYIKANITNDLEAARTGVFQAIELATTGSTGGGEAHSEGETWRPAGRVCVMATKD